MLMRLNYTLPMQHITFSVNGFQAKPALTKETLKMNDTNDCFFP